ncbi:urea transporter [Bordetella tumulicola]|uniref:urea transporter n=1 Tax=Bordetella tumulicola TaxID=1649133 RepID=UPI0039F12B40
MHNARPGFVRACLNGTSQVFFMENAWTGVLFFIAIGYSSYGTGAWATTIGALIGVVVATLTAIALIDDGDSISAGLYGFNGILVGAALPTLIEPSSLLWFYIAFGAAASTVVTAALSATLTKSWGIPGSTGPFVLLGWLMVAGAYSFGGLQVSSLGPVLATDYLQGASIIPSITELIEIFFRNIAQVFLLGSAVSGAIILLGIFIASVRAGIAACLGSIIAIVAAIVLRADPASVSQGLYGFSAVLTAMAVGAVFLAPGWRVAAYAGLATILTVVIQGALDAIMLPDGLPSFTMPYVAVLYLFMAPKKLMSPHGHVGTSSDHLLSD